MKLVTASYCDAAQYCGAIGTFARRWCDRLSKLVEVIADLGDKLEALSDLDVMASHRQPEPAMPAVRM